MDNLTDDQTSEKTGENDTLENNEDKTVEVSSTDNTGIDDVKKNSPDVDYKAELKALQAKLEKKDEIIGHKNRAIETLKKEREEQQTDEPAIEEIERRIEQLKVEQQQELNNFKMSFVKDVVEDEIRRVATSDDEAALIKFHLENSVKVAGFSKAEIADAIETAKLKANKKKILSNMKEMGEALKAKATVNTSVDTAGQKNATDTDNISEKERAFLKRYGV